MYCTQFGQFFFFILARSLFTGLDWESLGAGGYFFIIFFYSLLFIYNIVILKILTSSYHYQWYDFEVQKEAGDTWPMFGYSSAARGLKSWPYLRQKYPWCPTIPCVVRRNAKKLDLPVRSTCSLSMCGCYNTNMWNNFFTTNNSIWFSSRKWSDIAWWP